MNQDAGINRTPNMNQDAGINRAVLTEETSPMEMKFITEDKKLLPGKPTTARDPPLETLLPLDFEPAPYTVIFGKGRESKEAVGNKRLRVLATSFLPQYSSATDKQTKTKVISSIVSMVRNAPGGTFVKHAKNGRWYEVEDAVAREKVGYVFRDLLCDRYQSSSKSKMVRRQHKLLQQEEEEGSQAASRLDYVSGMPSLSEQAVPIPPISTSDIQPLDVSQPVQMEDEDSDFADLLAALANSTA
jgi:hypothetical protein